MPRLPDPRNDAAVVEPQTQRRSHRHLAVQAHRDADQVRRIRPGWHEVDDPHGAVRGDPVRLEHQGVTGVPPGRARARARGGERPVSRLVIVQECGERGRRVETGQAEPVDGPRGAHQGGRVQVAQQGVVFDFRHGERTLMGWAGGSDALGDVIADAQRVRDDRQGGVHGTDRGHEAAVHHVEVVQVVGLAVHVEDRGGRVGPEARRASLVSGGGGVERLVQVEAADERRVHHAELAQHGLEGPAEPGQALGVVAGLQRQPDRAVTAGA